MDAIVAKIKALVDSERFKDGSIADFGDNVAEILEQMKEAAIILDTMKGGNMGNLPGNFDMPETGSDVPGLGDDLLGGEYAGDRDPMQGKLGQDSWTFNGLRNSGNGDIRTGGAAGDKGRSAYWHNNDLNNGGKNESSYMKCLRNKTEAACAPPKKR